VSKKLGKGEGRVGKDCTLKLKSEGRGGEKSCAVPQERNSSFNKRDAYLRVSRKTAIKCEKNDHSNGKEQTQTNKGAEKAIPLRKRIPLRDTNHRRLKVLLTGSCRIVH